MFVRIFLEIWNLVVQINNLTLETHLAFEDFPHYKCYPMQLCAKDIIGVTVKPRLKSIDWGLSVNLNNIVTNMIVTLTDTSSDVEVCTWIRE